jgi:hypothetical protein
MKYEVDCVFGRWLNGEDNELEPTQPADIMRPIKAVYETAALQGGRVIAGHTMRTSDREYLFLVSELPDDPAPKA